MSLGIATLTGYAAGGAVGGLLFSRNSGRAGLFRTLGYVRAGGVMVASVDHAGTDTATERDRFLLKVLLSLAIPDLRAPRIVEQASQIR